MDIGIGARGLGLAQRGAAHRVSLLSASMLEGKLVNDQAVALAPALCVCWGAQTFTESGTWAWLECFVSVIALENSLMRPRRLSPTILSELVQVLSDGNYIATACQYVGIGESTFYEWRERGQSEVERLGVLDLDGESIALEACSGNIIEALDRCPEPFNPEEWAFVVFRYQTERARSRAEVDTLKLVRNAADTSWRAAAWYLERTHPERYGLRQNVNLAGSPGAPVQIQPVTVDELEATIERLRQQEGF